MHKTRFLHHNVFEGVRFLMETTQATQSVASDGFPVVVCFFDFVGGSYPLYSGLTLDCQMENQQIRDFLVEKLWQFGEHFQREQRTADAEVHVFVLRNLGACLHAAHHNRMTP